MRKPAFTVPLPAAKYWQSRHQHTRVEIGPVFRVYRTCRQRQPPVNVGVSLLSKFRSLHSIRLHAALSLRLS